MAVSINKSKLSLTGILVPDSEIWEEVHKNLLEDVSIALDVKRDEITEKWHLIKKNGVGYIKSIN